MLGQQGIKGLLLFRVRCKRVVHVAGRRLGRRCLPGSKSGGNTMDRFSDEVREGDPEARRIASLAVRHGRSRAGSKECQPGSETWQIQSRLKGVPAWP